MKKQVVITTSKETTKLINRNNYSKDEIKLMRDTIEENPCSALTSIAHSLSLKMGRSYFGLLWKINRLAKDYNRMYKHWPKTERDKLLSFFSSCKYGEKDKKVKEFAEKSGRTLPSVRGEVNRLITLGEIKIGSRELTGNIVSPHDSKESVVEERKPAIINVELPKGFAFEGASRKIEFCGDHVKIYF